MAPGQQLPMKEVDYPDISHQSLHKNGAIFDGPSRNCCRRLSPWVPLNQQMATTNEPYDVNFCFPVPQRIESARVALTPFNVGRPATSIPVPSHQSIAYNREQPALHGEIFHYQAALYPDIFKCFTFGPFESASEFLTFVEDRVQSNPGCILFCVWDKTKRPSLGSPLSSSSLSQYDKDGGALAGLIGLINSSRDMLATEIGNVLILPPFHRTHVASNAVGLLLHYALETSTIQVRASASLRDTGDNPSASPEDPRQSDVFKLVDGDPLGLRRVVWQANARNAASIRLAERMGFRFETVQRWGRVLPPGRPVDVEVRADDPKTGAGGLNAAMLSLCWDDWESGAREKAQLIIQRTH